MLYDWFDFINIYIQQCCDTGITS